MYAEGKLDEYLARFFPSGYEGVIVDVGACQPRGFSNSLYFEELGWKAVCIEPNPFYANWLRKERSLVYEYACGDFDADDVDFTVFSHPVYGEGSCSGLFEGATTSAMYRRFVPEMTGRRKIKVKVRKLDTLLENELSFVNKIDILSVDVEGTELDVMRGCDLGRWKPRFVVLEDFENDGLKERYMNKAGYWLCHKNMQNLVFRLRNMI